MLLIIRYQTEKYIYEDWNLKLLAIFIMLYKNANIDYLHTPAN